MARADFGKGSPLGTRLGLDRSTEWARARSDAHSNRHWNSDPQRGPAVSNRRRDTVILGGFIYYVLPGSIPYLYYHILLLYKKK